MSSGETIQVVVVDDEPLACRRIQRMLRNDPQIRVVATCHHGADALNAIRNHRPQLLFLDIQMPGMDGFGVLQGIEPAVMPQVIFVTAYDRYAIQAFEVHALDYLLKPFDRERFEKAVQRAKTMIQRRNRNDASEQLLALREELQMRPRYLERLVVRAGGRVFLVKTNEIDWIEAQGKYVAIHVGKDSHLIRESMTGLEEDLNPRKFLRIHRSTIVNVDRIREIQPWFHGDCRIILYDGKQLMLSRHYRQKFDELLGRPI